jgi:hypothetical protein
MEVGSDLWNARVYGGFSAASEVAAELERPRDLAFWLFYQWKMYRQVGWMNHGLGELFERWDRGVMLPQAEVPTRSLEPRDYRGFRDDVLRWHAVHARLLSAQGGFPRNALMRRRLARFEAYSERLLDLADWLDAMSNPEEMAARFSALGEDLAKGNVIPWSAVQ